MCLEEDTQMATQGNVTADCKETGHTSEELEGDSLRETIVVGMLAGNLV